MRTKYTVRSADTRTVRVREVAESIQYGHTASASASEEGPRFLRITDIQNGAVDWGSVPSCDIAENDIPKYRLAEGDLVFARTGAATGKSFLIRKCPDAVFASYLIRVRASKNVDPGYLAYFFQSPDYWRQIEEGKRGIGQPNVNGKTLGEIKLPLPPLDEQQHIVAEIEKQFTRLDAGVASLKRSQTALKRYRASLLNAACEGHLVGVIGERSRRQLAEVTTKIGSGSTPRGGDAVYRDKGVPFIRSLNVRSTGFRYQGLAYISDGHAKQLDHVVVTPRDVLLNITGASIGGVAVVPHSLAGARVSQHVCIIRPTSELLPAFLRIFLASPNEQARIMNVQVGATRQALTKAMLLRWEVPVPPIAEQQRIVAEVERRMSVIDGLEEAVKNNVQRATQIRRSILQHAFTGEITSPMRDDMETQA